MPKYSKHDPKTKREVVDRLLSYDFEGDIRQIGETPAKLERTGAQSFRVTFPESGRTYEFLVRIPRDAEEKVAASRPSEARSFASKEGVSEDWFSEPAKPTRRRRKVEPANV